MLLTLTKEVFQLRFLTDFNVEPILSQIPVVSDVPVGENLQDHVMGSPIEFYTSYSVSITAVKADNFMTSLAYSFFGTGKKRPLYSISN